MRTMIKASFAVAPYAGAWIETSVVCPIRSLCPSHPMRVRGLKLRHHLERVFVVGSHPMRVRGLKQGLVEIA